MQSDVQTALEDLQGIRCLSPDLHSDLLAAPGHMGALAAGSPLGG